MPDPLTETERRTGPAPQTRKDKRRAPLHRLSRALRPLRDGLTVPLLEGLRRAIGCVSHRAALRIGRLLGGTMHALAWKQRRLALDHLELAGIGASAAERRQIVRANFSQLGMNVIEWLHATHWSPAQLRAAMRIEGLEHLQSQGQRGCIVIAAHLGNWEIFPLAAAAHGLPRTCIMMTGQRNAALTDWLRVQRERHGNRVLSDQGGLIGAIRELRGGHPLALLADQDSDRWPGLFVEFFGRPAYTPEGPARLALRTGLPLIPMLMERERGDARRHVLHIETPILPDPGADPEAEVVRLTAAYTAVIEQHVRQRPEQWVWMHRRWRHQPGQRIKLRGLRRQQV